MPLFSSGNNYLGIDFDSRSVKVVELKNENGRPRLVTYGYFDQEVDKISVNKEEQESHFESARLIKQVCYQAKTTTNKVVSALPAFSVFSSILNLPAMSKKELSSAVEWEAKKVIPLPIEDMILDWKVLEEFAESQITDGQNENNGGENEEKIGDNIKQRGFLKIMTPKESKKYTKVLLTAAPKDLVKRYIDTFKAAGLSLLSLDTESFALIRSLVGNDKSALMIVDVGSVVTNVSVVVNGVPILNRSIDVGGLTITKAIANSLNVTLARAEQFKYDIGMNPNQTGQGSVPKTIETTLTPIVDEIKYSLNLYRSQGQKNIEKIILTGGSSMLLNLPEYLSSILNLKVYRGDSWARVIYPQELKPVLDEVGPRFSVAVGLAMRNIE